MIKLVLGFDLDKKNKINVCLNKYIDTRSVGCSMALLLACAEGWGPLTPKVSYDIEMFECLYFKHEEFMLLKSK